MPPLPVQAGRLSAGQSALNHAIQLDQTLDAQNSGTDSGDRSQTSTDESNQTGNIDTGSRVSKGRNGNSSSSSSYNNTTAKAANTENVFHVFSP